MKKNVKSTMSSVSQKGKMQEIYALFKQLENILQNEQFNEAYEFVMIAQLSFEQTMTPITPTSCKSGRSVRVG